MYKIRGQYEASDFQRAVKLHVQISPFTTYAGYFSSGIIVLLLLIGWFYTIRGQFSWLIVLYFTLFIVVGVIYEYVLRPYLVEHQLRKNTTWAFPFQIELTDSGLSFQNQKGTVNFSWNHVVKWKEDKDLFLLYTTDSGRYLLPKRLFASKVQVEYVHELLDRNRVLVARKVPKIREILLIILILIVAFVFTMYEFLAR